MFTNQKHYIPGIDVPGTNKGAFSAEHTFFRFRDHQLFLTALNPVHQFPESKTGEPAGRTGCHTAPTGNAKVKAWFSLRNNLSQCIAGNIQIGFTRFYR
jgi:hypothetical protein